MDHQEFTLSSRLGGITPIQLTDSLFRRVQLHRNSSFYAFLMRVCELVRASQMPDRSGERPSSFRDVMDDDDYMAGVFEEFIRNFYALKQHSFAVGRTRLNWNATAVDNRDLAFLPSMMTDVTLAGTGRTIVIDAKYYRDALQTHHNARTIHSSNLYQLMAYLRAEAASRGPERSVQGILLYPVGRQKIDLQYVIDGFPVRLYALDLGQHWSAIEQDLQQLIAA